VLSVLRAVYRLSLEEQKVGSKLVREGGVVIAFLESFLSLHKTHGAARLGPRVAGT
jgi:hypothetical protein